MDFKRLRAVTKPISKITESDLRVSFIGDVVERSQNRMVVGDDKAEIEVVYDDIDVPGSKIVRVIGMVQKPLHVRAEIIQSMKGLDSDLYRKVKNLYK